MILPEVLQMVEAVRENHCTCEEKAGQCRSCQIIDTICSDLNKLKENKLGMTGYVLRNEEGKYWDGYRERFVDMPKQYEDNIVFDLQDIDIIVKEHKLGVCIIGKVELMETAWK